MKAAVLGVGRMGRRHIQVARKSGCDVTGVFDIRQESLALAEQEYALAQNVLFTDLDRLYSTAKPEVVIIATTADSHAELAEQAAERGAKFILVEKPLAVSLAECDRMLATCARHGARLAVNHQMRFMEQYTEPKRLAGSGGFGGFSSMTVIAGNFGLSMNGSHYFEAFRFVAGEDIEEVSAWFSDDVVPNPRGSQFEDRAGSVRAVTKSGKRFYMDIGADQGHGVRVVYGCRTGLITVNELSGDMITLEREEEFRALPTTRYGMPAIERHVKIRPAEIIDTSVAVLRALIDDGDNVSGEDGRQAVVALVAAHQSARNRGAAVRLQDIQDRSEAFPWA
jgi:predicted dehydrogenase